MDWIKKNLLFVVGSAVAMVLLGVSGYFVYGSQRKYAELDTQITTAVSDLDRIYKSEAFPSKPNVEEAKKQREQLQIVITNSQAYFNPFPAEPVTSQGFRSLLDRTLFELQKRAEAADVKLPQKTYSFSFSALKNKVSFHPTGFPALPEQLAEVTGIANLLFDAQINRLESIRRTPVSPDDTRSEAEYHGYPRSTNALTSVSINTYLVRFQCFSPELERLLESIQKSPYTILIKTINVSHTAPGASPEAEPPPMFFQGPEGGAPFDYRRRYGMGMGPGGPGGPGGSGDKDGGAQLRNRYGMGPQQPAPQVTPRVGPAAPKKPQAVVNERIFQVELLIEILRKLKAQPATEG